MLRAIGSLSDIRTINGLLSVVRHAPSLSLTAELDSGSQVDLIPRMWVPFLVNLGCTIQPCQLEVEWVHKGHHLVLSECLVAHLDILGYKHVPTGVPLTFHIYDSEHPEIILGVQSMRLLDLFRNGDDLSRIQRELGLHAGAASSVMEPQVFTMDGTQEDLEDNWGPQVDLCCRVPDCRCIHFVASPADKERCHACRHGWSCHLAVVQDTPSSSLDDHLHAVLLEKTYDTPLKPEAIKSARSVQAGHPSWMSPSLVDMPALVSDNSSEDDSDTDARSSFRRYRAPPQKSKSIARPDGRSQRASRADLDDEEMPALVSDNSSEDDSDTEARPSFRRHRPPPRNSESVVPPVGRSQRASRNDLDYEAMPALVSDDSSADELSDDEEFYRPTKRSPPRSTPVHKPINVQVDASHNFAAAYSDDWDPPLQLRQPFDKDLPVLNRKAVPLPQKPDAKLPSQVPQKPDAKLPSQVPQKPDAKLPSHAPQKPDAKLPSQLPQKPDPPLPSSPAVAPAVSALHSDLTFGDSPATPALKDLCARFAHLFSSQLPADGANHPPMKIPFKEDFSPSPDFGYRRFPPNINEALEKEIAALLATGIIELVDVAHASVPFAAPVVMIPKLVGS
jgi:hypothetical protein